MPKQIPTHLFVWMTILSFIAIATCGGEEESEATEAIADKWLGYCNNSGREDAENCPSDLDVSGIVRLCESYAEQIMDTATCHSQLDAFISCAPQREWECPSENRAPTIAGDDPCAEEEEPFSLPSGSCITPIDP